MNCCATHCQAAEAKFGRKMAAADLRRYKRRGPDRTTRDIIRAVRGLGLDGASLLDVGGGVGVIQLELLGARFASATLVEAASAYLETARAECEARNLTQTTSYVHGDFAELAPDLPQADVVTLDRVVCCYPDPERLLTAAAAKARHACVISYPRDRWFVKLVMGIQNLGRRLVGDAFRTFVHSPQDMDRVLIASGVRATGGSASLVWRTVVYERNGTE